MRDCDGRRGGRQHLVRLGHNGRSRRGGFDRCAAVVKAGGDPNAKTDTNQSGADEIKRPAKHRQ
jgi:hypothetical protein